MNRRFSFSRRSKWLAMLIAGLLGLSIVGIALAVTITIDTFDDGDQEARRSGAGNSNCNTLNGLTGVIGGERDLYVYNATGGGYVSLATDTDDNNQAKFSQDSGVRGQGQIVWDGNDASCAINKAGLGNVDLTDSGTNDGIQLLVYQGDGGFNLGVWVYSNTVTSYYTLTIASAVAAPGQSFFVPFSAFSGDRSVFTSTGAIEFLIVPSAHSVDLTIDLFEATANKDFGDLPAAYNVTTVGDDGGRHIVNVLTLGTVIDREANGFETLTGALGDNQNNYDDEEGIQPSGLTNWSTLNGGNITVTVTGCTGTCYLNGWIDWDGDNSFAEAGDQVFTGVTVNNGTSLRAISVPTNAFWNQSLYARFRLCGGTGGSNDCGSTTGESATGEVEDYYWAFGPTAVTLASLQAQPVNTSPVLPVALVGGAAVILLGAVLFTRQSRKQSV